jgi:hypothetical protein
VRDGRKSKITRQREGVRAAFMFTPELELRKYLALKLHIYSGSSIRYDVLRQ